MSKFILVLLMLPVFGFGQTQSDYPESVLKNKNIKPLLDTSGNFVDSSSRHLLTAYLTEKDLNLHFCFTDKSYSDKTKNNLIYVNVWSLDNAEEEKGKK